MHRGLGVAMGEFWGGCSSLSLAMTIVGGFGLFPVNKITTIVGWDVNRIQVGIKNSIWYGICGIGDMGCGKKYGMGRDMELGI